MRTFIRGSLLGTLFIIAAGIVGGCGSGAGTKSGAPAQAGMAAGTQTYVMKAGGMEVLKVTTLASAKCVAGDGSLHFNRELPGEVEFWLVRGDGTVDEAAGKVSAQIASEFEDFKADQTTELTVAGSPAKRLIGRGHEADDHDPGTADVVVFKVGGRVFIACNHGEGLDPPTQQRMMAMLQTARAP